MFTKSLFEKHSWLFISQLNSLWQKSSYFCWTFGEYRPLTWRMLPVYLGYVNEFIQAAHTSVKDQQHGNAYVIYHQ